MARLAQARSRRRRSAAACSGRRARSGRARSGSRRRPAPRGWRRSRSCSAPHQRGQVGEDAAHDELFLAHRQQELIVELDGEQRLDEERLAGDRAVLHDALQLRRRRRRGRGRRSDCCAASRSVSATTSARPRRATSSSRRRVSVSRRRRIAARTRASSSLASSSTTPSSSSARGSACSSCGNGGEPLPAGRASAAAVSPWRRKKAPTVAHGCQRAAHLDQRLAVEHEALVRRGAQVRAHVGEGAQRRIAVLLEQPEALPGALERRAPPPRGRRLGASARQRSLPGRSRRRSPPAARRTRGKLESSEVAADASARSIARRPLGDQTRHGTQSSGVGDEASHADCASVERALRGARSALRAEVVANTAPMSGARRL